jgi:hypothetical protein
MNRVDRERFRITRSKPTPTVVYFITDGDAVKIGLATSAAQRMSDDRQPTHPVSAWHHGEWFEDDPAIRFFIALGLYSLHLPGCRKRWVSTSFDHQQLLSPEKYVHGLQRPEW